MGANAQTIVPTFTAGQVLTAAQMNQSARTGVPVFANTTDRDAAFGGAGEKTLAEGQLCYLESTDVVQYYDGSTWQTLAPFSMTVATATVAANQTTTNGTYSDLATVGPSVTLTTTTRALVTVSALLQHTATSFAYASYEVTGATSIAASDAVAVIRQNSGYIAASRVSYLTTLNAGSNTFTMKYKETDPNPNPANFEHRTITVMTW